MNNENKATKQSIFGAVTINERDIKVEVHQGATTPSQTDFHGLDVNMDIWAKELEEAEILFAVQARGVNRTDEIIREEQFKLEQLIMRMNWIHEMANVIERDYDFLNCQLNGLTTLVDWVDQLTFRRYGPFENYTPGDNSGRAELYNQIYQKYNDKIYAMSALDQICYLANQFSVASMNMQDKDCEVFQIVRILNIYVENLRKIDVKVRELNTEIELLKKISQEFQYTK